MTEQAEINRANALAADINALPGVAHCHIDDFSDNGGFNVDIRLHFNGLKPAIPLRGFLHSIRALVRRHDGVWEWFDGPKKQYKQFANRRYFDRYSQDWYRVSVGFYPQ